jgi:hypothetical protein
MPPMAPADAGVATLTSEIDGVRTPLDNVEPQRTVLGACTAPGRSVQLAARHDF